MEKTLYIALSVLLLAGCTKYNFQPYVDGIETNPDTPKPPKGEEQTNCCRYWSIHANAPAMCASAIGDCTECYQLCQKYPLP